MLTTKIKLIIAVGVAAGIFWSGWAVNNYRWQAKYSQLETEHWAQFNKINQEYINDVNVMAEAAEKLKDEIAEKDKRYHEQLTTALAQNSDLQRVVNDNRKRLLVRVNPNSQSRDKAAMPAEAASPGVDNGTRAELAADARQDYFDLRAAIVRVETKLKACQSLL